MLCLTKIVIFAPLYNIEKMKKVVRTVCIGALSGLAFLAACCTTRGGLTRAERKQLTQERDSIQEILKMREMSAVYGSPEIIARYGVETMRLRYELDSLNQRLGEEVDVEATKAAYEKSKTRAQLVERLHQLRIALEDREGACVYGSPEIIQKYGEETERMRQEVEEIQNQIKELDN